MGYIGIILLLILLILLFYPVRFYLDYIDGKTKLTIKLSRFLTFLVFDSEVKKPPKPKKQNSKKVKKTSKKDKNKEKNTTGKKVKDSPSYLIMDIIHTILDVLPHFGKSIRMLLQGITIFRCNIGVLLYEEDPCTLGIKCGKMQAVIYSVYPLLCHTLRMKHFKAQVLPNYLGQQESTAVELEAGTTLWKLLVGILSFLIHGGLKLLKSPIVKKQEPQTKTK